jgi:hypothetical protein
MLSDYSDELYVIHLFIYLLIHCTEQFIQKKSSRKPFSISKGDCFFVRQIRHMTRSIFGHFKPFERSKNPPEVIGEEFS